MLLPSLSATPVKAQVNWSVSFNDPNSLFCSYYPSIQSDVLAAGTAWSQYLQGDGTVNLQINFDPLLPTAEGASTTTSYVGQDGSTYVYEQGAAYKANTGLAANGVTYDGYITLGTDYLTQDLWFDPDPLARTAPVPSDKVDAVSMFEHEMGHILAFNGFRDPNTGALPSNYESTFDRNVVVSNGQLFFTGPYATQVYGGPVPLLSGDYGHVGNATLLTQDLMNGYSLQEGTRYTISPLDVAIAADSGVATRQAQDTPRAAVPEPSPALLLAAGLMLLAVPVRRRRRRR